MVNTSSTRGDKFAVLSVCRPVNTVIFTQSGTFCSHLLLSVAIWYYFLKQWQHWTRRQPGVTQTTGNKMSHLVTRVTTHSRRVCSLYKRALRNTESWYDRRPMYRYRAVLLRARFDENKDIKDLRVAQQLLNEGEKELFSVIHYQPRQFAHSPGGVAYGREVVPPDWVLDYWHPMEKAEYPEYFARREQRKKEYIEWWEKTYGKPAEPAH